MEDAPAAEAASACLLSSTDSRHPTAASRQPSGSSAAFEESSWPSSAADASALSTVTAESTKSVGTGGGSGHREAAAETGTDDPHKTGASAEAGADQGGDLASSWDRSDEHRKRVRHQAQCLLQLLRGQEQRMSSLGAAAGGDTDADEGRRSLGGGDDGEQQALNLPHHLALAMTAASSPKTPSHHFLDSPWGRQRGADPPVSGVNAGEWGVSQGLAQAIADLRLEGEGEENGNDEARGGSCELRSLSFGPPRDLRLAALRNEVGRCRLPGVIIIATRLLT